MQHAENDRLDEAMRRADDLLVGSLRQEEQRRRVRRMRLGMVAAAVAVCGGLAVFTASRVLRDRPAKRSADTVTATTAPAAPATQPAAAPELAAKLLALSDDWRQAFAVGKELASADPETAWFVLQANWTRVRAVDARQQILKAFAFAPRHPRLLDVMHLGMTDGAPQVRAWAVGYLRSIAFADFAVDSSRYNRWRAATAGRPLADVTAESARAWIENLKKSEAIVYDARAGRDISDGLRHYPSAREAVLAAGGAELAVRWLRDWGNRKDEHGDVVSCATEMLVALEPDEAFLRAHVLPMLDAKHPRDVRAAAVRVLGRPDAAWALEPLFAVLRDAATSEDRQAKHLCWDVAQALAEIGDARAIPHMIAAIAADNTYDTVYGVGYFGLSKITGVDYDKSHDGAWWRQWWERERQRFPEPARSTAVPTLERQSKEARGAGKAFSPLAALFGLLAADQDDAPPVREMTAGGKAEMKFFLIGPKTKAAPKDGYRLLLVLPGGNGSAEYREFVTSIAADALSDEYVVAQLVAPKWSENPDIIWPTQKLRDPKMKFTTEAFIDAVVADVSKEVKVNPKQVYALAWSSGGPAVYYAATRAKTPITGAFVAMSVFKPDRLAMPSPKLAGRAFYIFHSPQDGIRMSFPQNAEKALAKWGAKTTLVTYQGGHGWHGNVFGSIRAGMEWLETETTGTSATSRPSK